MNAINNSGFKIQANSNTATAVKNGDTLKFSNGKNIVIEQSGANITIKTSDTPEFTSVSIPTNTRGNKITLSTSGLNLAGQTITNLGSGGANPNSAANISDATRIAEEKAKHFVTTVKSDDKSVTITGGNTDKKEYNLSVNMTKVAQDIAFKYQGDTGGDKTKALSEKVVFQGTTNEIETKSTESGVSFKLADDVKNKLAKADKSLSEEKAATIYETKSNVSNIKTALEGKITTLENKQLTFTTQNGTTAKKLGESLTIEGENGIETAVTDSKIKVKLTAETKSKIENALSKTDAEAKYETKTAVDTKIRKSLDLQTITYKANSSTDQTTTFAQGFNFSDGNNTKAEVGSNGVVRFSLNSTLSNITSIEGQTGNAKLTFGDNLSLNSKKLTGLANATVDASSTDAVTGKQLFALQEKPLTFSAQSGANFSKKLGETVRFEGLNGLSTLTVGDKIQITIENDTKQKIDNALSTQDAEAKYETKANVDKISQNITALQNGVITFKAGKGTQTHATKLGGNITIKAGSFNEDGNISANNALYSANNLATTIDGTGNLLIGFKDSPTFNQLTANSLTIQTGGTNPIVINQDGINAGGKAISHVGSGGNTDTNAANIADAKDIADKAAKRLATTVSSGNSTIIINEENTDDKKNFKVSVNTTQISEDVKLKYAGDSGQGENKLSERVKFEGNAEIVTAAENNKVTFKLSTETATKIDKGNRAVQDIKIGTKASDNNTLITLNQTQNRFNIIGADNIQTEIDGANITVKLAKDIEDLTRATFGNNTDKATLTKDGLTITNGGDSVVLNEEGLKFGDKNTTPSISKAGINAGNTSISNLQKVELTKDGNAAATTGQVYDLKEQLDNKTLTYKANGTNNKIVKLSDGLDFTDGTNTNATIEGNGIVKFNLNSTLTGIQSITNNGSTLSISNDGFNFGNKQLSNVAKGTKNGDVVTYDQLNPIATALNATLGTDGAITAPSYSLKSGNDNPVVHGTVGSALNALDTALSEVKNTATNALSELKFFAKSGKDTADTNANVTLNNQNQRLNIIGESNIETNISENDIKISLSKNISLEQITLSKDGKNTKIDSEGIKITGGPALTNVGLDIANKSITNLSSGITTDPAKQGLAKLEGQNGVNIAKNAVAVEDLKKLGWILSVDKTEGNETQEFKKAVTNANTVKFNGSDAIKITGGNTGDTNTIKVDVNTTKLVKNADGKHSVAPVDEAKLVTAKDITDALNSTSFKVTIGKETNDITDQNGKSEHNVTAGSGLTFKAGKNLIAQQSNGDITFATAEDVTFNKINTETLIVGDPKNTNKQTTLTSSENGLSLGNKKLTGINAGTSDTDAVNAKQLSNLTKLLGGSAALANDGNITAPTYTLKAGADTGKDSKDYNDVGSALSALDIALDNTTLSLTQDGNTEATNVNLKKQKLKVVGQNGATIEIKDQTITVGIDNALVSANTDIAYTANNDTNKKKTKLNTGFNFTNGTNTNAEIAEDGVVKFNLNSELTGINSINANNGNKASLTFNDGSINVSGKLTGLTDGTISDSSTDVITGKQLHGSVDSLAKVLGGNSKVDANGKVINTTFNITQPNGTLSAYDNVTSALEAVSNALNLPLTFAGNQGNTTRTLNTTIKFYGGLNNTTLASNKNLRTNVTDTGVELLFSNNPEFDSIKLGNNGQNVKLSVEGSTLKIAGTNGTDPVKISNVAQGTADNDAINVKQFKELITTLGGESKLNDDGTVKATTYSLNAGKTTPTTHNNVSSALNALDTAISNISDTALLSYKANDGQTKTVSLKTGLNFKNGKNTTALIEDNGVVKVDVNTTLNDMKEINGGTNKGSLTFNDNNTKLQAGVDKPSVELTDNKATISGGKDKATATFDETAKITAGDNKANFELKDNEAKLQAGDNTKASVNVTDNIATISAGENKSNLKLEDGKATLSAGPDKATITLGDDIVFNDRKLTGVKKGIANTDAVNREQLNPLAEVLGATFDPNTGAVTKPTFSLNAGNTNPTEYTKVGEALTALDNALTDVKKTADNAIATFEVGDGTNKFDVTKANNRFDIVGKDNIETKVDGNKINVALKKDLAELDSVTFNKGDTNSVVKLDKNGLSITPEANPTPGNTLKITGGKDGGAITGLENRIATNGDYGTGNNVGRAATEGAVKDLSDKLSKSDSEINSLKNGESGPVVYTDAQGEPIVKVNNKYYKAKDIENGQPKANAVAVDKPTHLSLKNPDGSTKDPVALGNVGSGLAKDNNGNLIPAHKLSNEQVDKNGDNAVNVKDLKATADALIDSGIQFGANKLPDDNKAVTHKLGNQVDIVGADSEFKGNVGNEEISATAKNIVTKVFQEGNGKTRIDVGLSKDIKGLEKLALTDKDNASTVSLDGKSIKVAGPTIDGNTNELVLTNDKDGGKLTGLANRVMTSENKNDFGKGDNAGRAATEGAVKQVYDDTNNGVIGTVVYTDKDGTRLVNIDGKYYKPVDIQNGKPKPDASAVQKPILSLADIDGSTNSKEGVTLGHIANGDISVGSKEAVNGDQLAALGKTIGEDHLEIKDGKQVLKPNTFATITGADGTATPPNNVIDAINTINNSGTKYAKVNSNGESAVAKGQDSIAMGSGAKSDAKDAISIGKGATAETVGSVAIGDGAIAGKANIVTNPQNESYGLLDGSKVAGRTGIDTKVLSVGRRGDERQIQHVAPGVISATSTDAVNGSQLHQTNQQVLQNSQRIDNISGNVKNLYAITGELKQEMRSGVASAVATASLPMAYIPGKSLVSVAGGSFQGQQAVALGLSRVSDNGKMIFKVNTGYSNGSTTMGVGAGFLW